MTDEINPDEKIRVSENMMKFGGSFVKALGEALSHADLQNQRKIKTTWPEYWNQYNRFGDIRE